MHQKLSSNTKEVVIREAGEPDLGAILSLVRELADYEKGLDKVTATIDTYRDAYANGYFSALVAEVEGQTVGMALYYKAYSTWKGRMMYLEDFVVREEFRRFGIGALLFEKFLEKAREVQSVMCKWQVLRWNEPAINFYRKYDTVFDDEWLDVKMYF